MVGLHEMGIGWFGFHDCGFDRLFFMLPVTSIT